MAIKAIGIYLSLYTELLIKDDFCEFLSGFPKIQITGILLSCNDDIVSLGEKGLVKPEEFPDQPLDSVPFYRITRLPGDCDPQSRNAQPVPLENDGKMFRAISFSRSI